LGKALTTDPPHTVLDIDFPKGCYSFGCLLPQSALFCDLYVYLFDSASSTDHESTGLLYISNSIASQYIYMRGLKECSLWLRTSFLEWKKNQSSGMSEKPTDFLYFYSYAFRYCLTGTVLSLTT
jgi:hypothetical protein